jgi:hypothetical protein
MVLLTFSAVSRAGEEISLSFPGDTQFEIFESSGPATTPPARSAKMRGVGVSYKISSSKPKDFLYVVNPDLGLAGSKVIGEIGAGSWSVVQSDFKLVYQVTIALETPKGPAAAATVDLEDDLQKRSQLVDPDSKGVANFYFVKPGDLKVTVRYNSGGKPADPIRQTFELALDLNAKNQPSFKIALPSGDSVAPAPSSGSTKATTEPASKSSGNPFGNVLVTLIGFAFVGAVAFFVFRYMKQNPDKVSDTLTKLGADVPKADDSIPFDNTPMASVKNEPIQPIILDQSAAPITSAVTVTGTPKLIAQDGSPFELPEGETVVGREFGNALTVPNDTISRRHASVIKTGSDVEVQDHESTNGTWVNGAKVAGSQGLRNGDSVRFGSVEFKYEA